MEMLSKYIQNSHSKPQLPWLPVPCLLTDGEEFFIYLQETENSLIQMTKQKVLVQTDLWGYFIYWNFVEQQSVCTLDLMHVEDIEICTHNSELPQTKDNKSLRLQISAEGIVVSGNSNLLETLCKLEHPSITLLLVCEDFIVLESWKNALLRLVFTHYTARITLAPLELLWKQWTHLILVCSKLSPCKDEQTSCNSHTIVPDCCLTAALGIEGDSVHKQTSFSVNEKCDGKYFSGENIETQQIRLENLTFDYFFSLFVQLWPREDIADLFSAHTKSKGYMNCQELNSFLQTSISYFANSSFPVHNSRGLRTNEKQRTLRHIKYLHMERTQHNITEATPAKTNLNRKPKSQKLQNVSCLKRSRSCYTTEKSSVHRSRKHTDNVSAAVYTPNSPEEFLSLTSSPMHQDKSDVEESKGQCLPVIVSEEEFVKIIQHHETNKYAASKCLLSNEGFYRLLLSSTYRELSIRPNVPSHSCEQWTVSHPTEPESFKYGLLESEHPLAHYYIKSAYLINKIHKQTDNIDQMMQNNDVAYFNAKFHREISASAAHNFKSNNILRTIRQALFCGVRALILDCHHLSRLVGTEANIFNELIVVPMNKNKIPTCFRETTSQDSFNLMRSILHKNHPYALVKSVLQVLNENIFLVSNSPFILILNLHGLSQEQQCRLANLLQEYLGQWMMVSPLPRYSNHLNSNLGNKLKNKGGSTGQRSIYTRHLPSPEMLKNKVLLSIRLVRTSKSLSEDQSQELISNTSRNISPTKKFMMNPEITAPLTVFVTNPEGEQKSASQDIGSTNSSSQISPPTTHKLNSPKLPNKTPSPITSPYMEHRNPNCSASPSYNMYTNTVTDRNATFPSQDEITYLHPRLARLAVLLTPEFPSDTCIALHNQYSLNKTKLNTEKGDSNYCSQSHIFHKSGLKGKSDESKVELIHHENSHIRNPETIQEAGQQVEKQIDEAELLTSIFNIITTRKALLKHEERKRKLLKHLVSEVYGDATEQRSAVSRSIASSCNIKCAYTSVKRQEQNNLPEKVVSKPHKGWFKKRVCTSPPKKSEQNAEHKDTFLTATVRYARRLSNASIQNRKPTDIQENDEQEPHFLDNNLIKRGSLLIGKESDKNVKQSKLKQRKQTQDLQSSHKSRRQSRKSSDNSYRKRSPNSSCGHCSCSSGSRSEKSSPVHEISQKQVGQSKLGYFRDGLQKFRNKFANEKRKSFEKYSTPTNLTNTGRSIISWSESEPSLKSDDSGSTNTVSTVSSTTEETSLSSNTKSSRSTHSSADSFNSSSDNKLNQQNVDSPVKGVLAKSFQASLSNVRHSITSLTNALFHQDKSHKRSVLKRQSTIDSYESCPHSPTDYWLDSLRWFIGPKLTNVSSADLMYLLSKKQMTKSLARYNKERLTCVFLSDKEKSWDHYQLFRSAGCQLIPYDLDVSPFIYDINKPVSVRQQFMKFSQTCSLQNNRGLLEDGYTLKPALLRIPTINRYHRQLISRNKFLKRFQKSKPNSPDVRNQIQNYLKCACCYDPLDIGSEREMIGKISDGTINFEWPVISDDEKHAYLPWNFTVQLLNFMRVSQRLSESSSSPTSSHDKQNVQTPRKLPKRYRRAANATATRQRHASAGRMPLSGITTNSENDQSTKDNFYLLTPTKHKSQENIHLKNAYGDFQENREGIIIDAEIKAPLFKFSHLSTDVTSRFWKVPMEHDAIRYRLYPNNSFVTKTDTNHNQYSLGNSKILSRSSYALLSPLNDKERIYMCSSFSSMPRSNSELMLDSMSTRKVTFSRIHLPESISIQLSEKMCRKMYDDESNSVKNIDENTIASCTICANSPLNKTLTGFQHFQLQLLHHPKKMIQKKTDDIIGFNHMVFHQRLKATIGLLIFCKVSMNTYVPNSLGDLIETLSKEYDTRSKSKPCKQMDQNQQCNVNRSRSYVQLDRQHSIRENSIMKQPVMRSNSFTYKQHHRSVV
uniref:Phosphoinositide phospholipase C n=2 Tax=Trichobilharzia regenti TaxID=157069 RepID=A0AA85J8M4_TRIRE|nr:unnamed protein product [Trichobilharzia regenti]